MIHMQERQLFFFSLFFKKPVYNIRCFSCFSYFAIKAYVVGTH